MFNIQLVEETKVFWKLYSANILAIIAALSGLNGFFGFLSKIMPTSWVFFGISILAVVAYVARFIKQPAVGVALAEIAATKAAQGKE